MKKLLIALLAIAMVASLVACAAPAAPAASEKPAASSEAPAAVSSEAPAASSSAAAPAEEYKSKTLYIGVAIRSLSNPYHVNITEGAQMFGKYLDKIGQKYEIQVLACEGSNEKQVNDIKAFVAKANGNAILYVDPNEAAIAPAIADICEESKSFMVTAWNRPDDVGPMDYTYWVAHHSPDNKIAGHDIAVAMFNKFKTPGTGKILAVQGMLGNTAASDRFIGLQNALKEFPNVQMLAEQAADWDTKKALSTVETWLTKYPDVDGVWCANDSMAMGAIQALKAKGVNGKIQVVGVDGIGDAVTAIKAGDMTATVGANPWLQCGYSLAIAYDAWRGVIKVADLKQDQRVFNTEGLKITADTVADYEAKYINSKPDYDFSKPFDCIYVAK